LKKITIITAGVATLALVSAAVAFADGGRHGARMFNHLDSDDNGVITQEEASDAASERFARKDANADGYLDVNELMARWSEGPIDTDGDGKISAAEHAAIAAAMFLRADANGDGGVDEDEAGEFAHQMRERRHENRD
jgi:Ca2+-binding EF-hand superfamily protein